MFPVSNKIPQIIDVSSPSQVALLRQASLKFRAGSQAEAFAAASSALAFVAVDGREAVGWCWGYQLVRPDAGSMLYLHGLEVGQEHRRRGVGRALVEAFMATGRDAGATTMFLFTATSNEPATRLYESLGGGPPGHGPTSNYWFRLR